MSSDRCAAVQSTALWDSVIGKGFIAELRWLVAGNDMTLIRSFLKELIAQEHPRRRSAGQRADSHPVRRVTVGSFNASDSPCSRHFSLPEDDDLARGR
jgi:hypothetical protein